MIGRPIALALQWFVALAWWMILGWPDGSHLVADGEVEISVKPSVSQIQVAEPLELQWNVTHPPSVEIEFPDLGQSLGPWQIIDKKVALDLPNSRGRISSLTLTLESLESGRLAVPSMTVTVRQDQTARELESPEVSIQVISSLDDQVSPERYRDIQGVRDVFLDDPGGGESWKSWAVGLGLTLLIGLVGAMAIGIVKRKRLTPKQWALQRLEQIRAIESSEGQPNEPLSKVIDTLRQYLEMRFTCLAPTQTTQECLQGLDRHPEFSAEWKANLKAAFERADLLKFAGVAADSSEVVRAIDSAIQLIESVDRLEVSSEARA